MLPYAAAAGRWLAHVVSSAPMLAHCCALGVVAGSLLSLLPLWLSWAVAVGLCVVIASAAERWGGR